jgi:hypothetical protein
MPAAPEHPTITINGMCLLHGDYHPMDGACWTATAHWYFGHQHLDDREARDFYLAEVERAMLDHLVPLIAPDQPGRP